MGKMSLPPGFRFHPTDVELLLYFLKRKVLGRPFPIEAIGEVDLYKFSPDELPGKSCLKTREREWYFFCRRDPKYSNGLRTNRSARNGYWKTTGKDRIISHNSRDIGKKKTLIFHIGKAPQVSRTDWVIHEYRLDDPRWDCSGIRQDEFVLCRLFEKSGLGPKTNEQYGAPFLEEEWEDDELSLEISHQVISSGSPPVQSSIDNVEQPMDLGPDDMLHIQSSQPELPGSSNLPSQLNDPVQEILCSILHDEESVSPIIQENTTYSRGPCLIDNVQGTPLDNSGPQTSASRVELPLQFAQHIMTSVIPDVESEKMLMSFDEEPQACPMESLVEARCTLPFSRCNDFELALHNGSVNSYSLENGYNDMINFAAKSFEESSLYEQFGSPSWQLTHVQQLNACLEADQREALCCPPSSVQGDFHCYQPTATTNGTSEFHTYYSAFG